MSIALTILTTIIFIVYFAVFMLVDGIDYKEIAKTTLMSLGTGINMFVSYTEQISIWEVNFILLIICNVVLFNEYKNYYKLKHDRIG